VTYVYFEGDFGRVNVGAESAAPYLMAYAAPFVGLGVNSPNFLLFAQQGGAPTYSYLIGSGDANKLTYFSPRISGFQFGISYTPNVDAPGGDRQTFGLTSDNDEDEQSNWISLGANYENSFDSVDVALSLGYERGDVEADADGTSDNHTSWFVGGNVGFSGFTVGGSYSVSNQGLSGDNDDTAFDVGVSYTADPWAISVTYLHGEQENGAGASEDEVDLIELGASYALGPGVELAGSIQRWDEKAIAPGSNNDGWAVAVQTRLAF
jgi:predicted porin